jgi:hypothetical protein
MHLYPIKINDSDSVKNYRLGWSQDSWFHLPTTKRYLQLSIMLLLENPLILFARSTPIFYLWYYSIRADACSYPQLFMKPQWVAWKALTIPPKPRIEVELERFGGV